LRWPAVRARAASCSASFGLIDHPACFDASGESVGVFGEEVSEVGVVEQRSAGVELVPDGVAAALPGALDVGGLGRLDWSGREEMLALGDVAPDDLGCAMAFEVAECGLIGAWGRRQPSDDVAPLFGVERPVLERCASLLVVDQVWCGVELVGEVV